MSLIPISTCLSFTLCFVLWKYHKALNIIDHPNHRSMHETPTPRSGGIGFVLTALLLMAFLMSKSAILTAIISTTLCLFLLSLLDDIKTISAGLRLLLHLAFCFGFLFVLHYFQVVFWPTYSLILLFFIGVWFINLFNFMDGLDGLCTLVSLLGFVYMGLFGLINHQLMFALCAFIISASLIGFLLFNFPPARLFMGDCGSTSLGFLSFAFIVWGVNIQLFSFIEGFTFFAPFLFDATVTLARRVLNGEKFWQPHRTHYYQRAKQSGVSNQKILFFYGAMMSFSAITVMLSSFFDVQSVLLLPYLWFVVYGINFDKSDLS
jgi:UDP-N-acetylmuramyl pentapeptide phosphotransferase/UDP-N-acetylglucosamine-1-phosphate transferase